jgi:hypothetical protein
MVEVGDVYFYVGGAAVLIGLGLWVWQKYGQITADGKITIGELISAVKEGEAEVIDALEKIEELEKMRKADLQDICRKHGLNVSGTKAELVDRIQAKIASL